ncbi:hypothetical protein MLD38_037283 [Melastoma candidum]|uniref:Uncharacterized protein n=1 Tax=Melastoma candidum TaxID=119954 RepID=A0ACB9LNH5_9MYRT|nr:hypothetical protein MLD38_037283 [Melastoma candidum]
MRAPLPDGDSSAPASTALFRPHLRSRFSFLAADKTVATKKNVGALEEADLKGKRVFVRVDLNVPLDDCLNITDDTRIKAAVPTIKYLISHGSIVILSSHLPYPLLTTPYPYVLG